MASPDNRSKDSRSKDSRSNDSCSNCGSLLPTVPTDPRHPTWCPSCVARSVGVSNFPSIPPPPPGLPTAPTPPASTGAPLPAHPAAVVLATRPQMAPALLVGVATAALAGLGWWALVSISGYQITIGAIGVGLLVGHGVLIGARRGGIVPAVIAVVATLVALVVSEYFILRSLAIEDLTADIPLWQGLELAREAVNSSVRDQPLTAVFWLIAAAVAASITFPRGRRPIL